MQNSKMEIIDAKSKQKKKVDKIEGRIFQDALRKAATTEIVVEKKNINGDKYSKRLTAVEALAEQIIGIALSDETPLADKLKIYEKMAKISEGENKQIMPITANTTNNTLNLNMSYEEFIKMAHNKLIGVADDPE